MAPGRTRSGKLPTRGKATVKATAQDGVDDGVPQVFREMLAADEALSNDFDDFKSSKRRRVGEGVVRFQSPEELAVSPSVDEALNDLESSDDTPLIQRQAQVAEDLDQDSDDEDFEWEEVDVATAAEFMPLDTSSTKAEEKPLTITLADPTSLVQTVRRRVRKPVTNEEKKVRLDVHKTHLLCLLFHAYQRNHWCNDELVQRILRKALRISPKIVEKLFPDASKVIQFQRSKLLKEALADLSETWRMMFQITEHGQRRACWDTKVMSQRESESFLDLLEFREKAIKYRGSADYGAQLFCALLRGLGLETRLICSLQPLAFASSAANVSPARDPSITTVYAAESDDEHVEGDTTASPVSKPRRIARLGRGRRGNRVPELGVTPSSVSQRSRAVSRPRHPIFWVEVFDEAYQTWIAVDPMATGNVGKPLSLEPGMNDPENLLSYVIAFEDDNTARDVTRRYTKAYNAKTRKLRVECTDHGISWYKKALRLFRRRRKRDRDLVEVAYFIQRDIQEGMPKNIEDFKGHPVYVLERHLYRDEALHPKHEVGKVGQNAKAANLTNLESVYRRQDVHLVKSADKWFRQGRQLRENQQALKFVKARRRQEIFDDPEAVDEIEEATVGLYAHFQTELYVPPPATSDGLVPRNTYGNLDIYTRSMIPAGTVHVKSKHGRQAARILGIDHVDAITGFNFRGRHGTAVVNGVVVASESRDAIVAVLESMAYTREREETEAKRAKSLKLWRKFLLGLQIVENVKQYRKPEEESDDEGGNDSIQQEIDAEMNHFEDVLDNTSPSMSLLPEIGAFEVVESIHKLAQPPARLPVELSTGSINDLFDEIEDGGFLRDDESTVLQSYNQAVSPDIGGGGGFMIEESEDVLPGGGFVQESDFESTRSNSLTNDKIDLTKDQNLVTDNDIQVRANGSPMHGIDQEGLIIRANDATLDNNVQLEADAGPPSGEKELITQAKEKTLSQQSPGESDTQSLLSHDPEDDEIDPDWL